MLHNELPNALVVWLQVDAAEAIDRMGDTVEARPLLRQNPGENMQQLHAERTQYYERAALLVFPGD